MHEVGFNDSHTIINEDAIWMVNKQLAGMPWLFGIITNRAGLCRCRCCSGENGKPLLFTFGNMPAPPAAWTLWLSARSSRAGRPEALGVWSGDGWGLLGQERPSLLPAHHHTVPPVGKDIELHVRYVVLWLVLGEWGFIKPKWVEQYAISHSPIWTNRCVLQNP